MERAKQVLTHYRELPMSDKVSDICECCGRERERIGEVITNPDDWSATSISWVACRTCYAMDCECKGYPWTSGLRSDVGHLIPSDLRQQQYERSLN